MKYAEQKEEKRIKRQIFKLNVIVILVAFITLMLIIKR